MKIRYAYCAVIILLLHFFTACESALNKEKLHIKGSNTMGEHLLPELVRAFCECQGINIRSSDPKNISGSRNDTIYEIQIELSGSQKGLEALADTIQNMIGMVSENQVLKAQKVGDSMRLGRDSLVIVTHRYNPLNFLTLEQVQAIFSGRVQHWAQLTHLYQGTIHVHTRDSMSGTHLFFQQHLLADAPLSKNAKAHHSNQDLLEDIRRDFGGIGYLSAAEWTPSEDFRAIPIKNTPAQRDLYLIYRNDKLSNFSKEFLAFCRDSSQAKEIIKGLNFKL